MKYYSPHYIFLVFVGLSACDNGGPSLLGKNETGIGVVATPSTYGVTSLTTVKQLACTEPRPSAGVEIAQAISGAVSAEVPDESKAAVSANIAAAAANVQNIEATSEFERVEFLSHGLFGICQISASLPRDSDGSLTDASSTKLIELIETLFEEAAGLDLDTGSGSGT